MRRWVEDLLLSIWTHKGVASTLLLPLSWAYGYLSRRHMQAQASTAWRAPVPVIVIGNILLGGTGKTPVTAAVCQALQATGWAPGIISRGYGVRVGHTPHLSDTEATANHLGDEPALLHTATAAPVSVHPNRSLAARHLLDHHPEVDILIADDGLQHRALARDIEIIVQDARGIGNGRLLPAGPLREPANRLAQADWLITQLSMIEKTPESEPETRHPPCRVTMHLCPTECRQLASGRWLSWADWHEQFSTTSCSAAAGIGHPERFFTMLRSAGVALTHTLALPDHGTLTPTLLKTLPAGPVLITAKDAIKCTESADPRLWVVRAEPTFDDPTWLASLESLLRHKTKHSWHKRDDRH